MSDTDFASAFDDWIGGASINKRSVPIYGKPGLYARWQELDREHRKLTEAANGEGSLGDANVAAIEDEMTALEAEWEASKSVWVVRPISEADRFRIEADMGDAPLKPVQPPAGAPDAERATYERKRKVYELAKNAYADRVNIQIIAAAVESITFADGRVAHGVTVEQIETMRTALGEAQLLRLIAETTAATIEEPTISGPKSLRNSAPDQT